MVHLQPEPVDSTAGHYLDLPVGVSTGVIFGGAPATSRGAAGHAALVRGPDAAAAGLPRDQLRAGPSPAIRGVLLRPGSHWANVFLACASPRPVEVGDSVEVSTDIDLVPEVPVYRVSATLCSTRSSQEVVELVSDAVF
ncbi:unnamed protein product [Prorocentrum cordatum]|uniref:Uncharacterized protein n=1 Tax=Prorocentrum cordatum TaxID=2364126 RepID=A0ABN9R0T7_9DINO|nr:unnamed protein product [Polarella glacialis]